MSASRLDLPAGSFARARGDGPGEGACAPTNVLVVGVGGQGVIMVSKVLARVCQLQGHEVKQSEVHGMAKRGGSVFSHVRFGSKVFSPSIPKGAAHVLVALEWAEGLRWLSHLDPARGVLIADTQRIVPPFACLDRRPGALGGYSAETPREIVGRVADGYALDASGMAGGLGNAKVANTILLGALSAVLEIAPDAWPEVLGEFVPPKTVEVNREAFRLGREWIDRARRLPPEARLPASPSAPETGPRADEPPAGYTLEITESWCKGCDICVKMCPERCLRLDAHDIVRLTDPAACTGCRICEWLCPDFAIAVRPIGG